MPSQKKILAIGCVLGRLAVTNMKAGKSSPLNNNVAYTVAKTKHEVLDNSYYPPQKGRKGKIKRWNSI